jgi:hypothetical protein
VLKAEADIAINALLNSSRWASGFDRCEFLNAVVLNAVGVLYVSCATSVVPCPLYSPPPTHTHGVLPP